MALMEYGRGLSGWRSPAWVLGTFFAIGAGCMLSGDSALPGLGFAVGFPIALWFILKPRSNRGVTGERRPVPVAALHAQFLAELLKATKGDLCMIGTGQGGAVYQVGTGTCMVARIDHPWKDFVRAGVKGLRSVPFGPPLRCVLVGGPRGTEKELLRLLPWIQDTRIAVFHLDDTGAAWGRNHTAADAAVIDALEVVQANPNETVLDVEIPFSQAQIEENQRNQGIEARPTPATTGLVVAIGAVFLAQLAWDGTTFVPSLARAGAIIPGAGWGAPTRWLSSTLLHVGFAHAVSNAIALLAFGSALERTAGSARMITAYVVCGAAGGAVSSLAGTGVTAGASGAIWGLMTAMLWLSWRRRDLTGTRRGRPLGHNILWFTFAQNMLISLVFLEQISLASHLGGGVAGLLLAASGLLTRGVSPQVLGSGIVARGIAALAAAALPLSLVFEGWTGRPWELAGSPTMVPVTLVGGGTAQVPAPLLARREEQPAAAETSLGGFPLDPAVVAFKWTPVPDHMTPEDFALALVTHPELPEGIGQGRPTPDPRGASTTLEVEGLEGTLYARIVGQSVVQVTVFTLHDTPEQWRAALRQVPDSVGP